MKKIIKLTLGYGLAASLLGCTSSGENQQQGPQAVAVNIYEVKKEEAVSYNNYPGTVVALNEVELRSEVSGLITGIFFKEGQYVEKGKKLYEIDRSKYLATYQQAKAGVEIAQANLEKAEKDAKRYTKLGEQDAIAKQKVDYAITDLQNAKLQVASAKADLVKAHTDLGYSLINAPFGGTIGISQVKMGALVNPGQTLLNTISSNDPMAVDFVIDEKDLSRFIRFDQHPETYPDSLFTMRLPDHTLYTYPGKLHVIDRAVDPQTGTIKVRLTFPDPENRLRTGMSCTIRVLNSAAEPQILIPYKAVMEQMSEYFVFVVENEKAQQKKVTLGDKMGEGKVIVQEGLKPGDKIVVEGIQKLRDGTPIQISQPQAAGDAASSQGNAAAASDATH